MTEEVTKQTRDLAQQDIEQDKTLENNAKEAEIKKAKQLFSDDPASYRLPFPEVLKEDSKESANETETLSVAEIQTKKKEEIKKAVSSSFEKDAKDAIKSANSLAE